MKMRRYLRQTYARLKAHYLSEIGFVVPERYASSFVSLGGAAEVQFIYGRFSRNLPKAARILLVGAKGGRDYFFLKNLGFDVVAVDIGLQPDIQDIVVCNVEEPLPFDEHSFDAALLGEVLEHLRDDVRALENVRRVLKPEGLLMVSIPFYHDAEEGHMRIHSPKSGVRLLQMGGFSVIDYLERPGIFWLRGLNVLQHGLSLIAYLLTGKTVYRAVINIAGTIEWEMGHVALFRPIRRATTCFGGYYLCRKAEIYDHLALNKKLYTLPELPT